MEWLAVVLARRDAAGLREPGLPSTLLRVPFDPVARGGGGPPEPILKGTRAIRDHEVSPDGEWIAFTEAGVQEDLFVARVDGTQYRRLTDDAFRDRGPAWAPDGDAHRVLLGSVRLRTTSGRSARTAAGSALRRARHRRVSRYGRPTAATFAFGFETWHFVDFRAPVDDPATRRACHQPDRTVLPASWSATGGRIAGQVIGPEGWLNVAGRLRLRRSSSPACRASSPGRRLALSGLAGRQPPPDRASPRRHRPGECRDRRGPSARHGRRRHGRPQRRRLADNKWITYTETATEGRHLDCHHQGSLISHPNR